MKTIQIAIDGPASSGKSTVAKIIAKDFGYTYLDTGAMYRAATYVALQHQISPDQSSQLLELLDQYPISFGRSESGEQLVFLGDVDVSHPIRENAVTNAVSSLQRYQLFVRSWLLFNKKLLNKVALLWMAAILVR